MDARHKQSRNRVPVAQRIMRGTEHVARTSSAEHNDKIIKEFVKILKEFIKILELLNQTPLALSEPSRSTKICQDLLS